ncbi:hypothetical protein H257_15569 [Aphanomyces astaci]|uniref:Uncharacterized protein n=1 Tax=Aphanomyces astaci TaxID=112090 RepID=W4FP56_APHAT|nr:hypothetical protein H257_15569 [Aphanomyces astaci]ETV68594.1 hypothetical protein H257_15569 [Aphanomyces astaci]|eukprot:XP_009842023.1 hypothetical protein H257_15569 [Aphanomyces astaci]
MDSTTAVCVLLSLLSPSCRSTDVATAPLPSTLLSYPVPRGSKSSPTALTMDGAIRQTDHYGRKFHQHYQGAGSNDHGRSGQLEASRLSQATIPTIDDTRKTDWVQRYDDIHEDLKRAREENGTLGQLVRAHERVYAENQKAFDRMRKRM